MRKVSDLNKFSNDMQEPSVDPSIFSTDATFDGGMQGKTENRKHVGIESVIGRVGNNSYFRGRCWGCDNLYIGTRYQNKKRLLKCPNCDKTSFVYKGFFNDRSRYPIQSYTIPMKNEIEQTVYICYVQNKDMSPYISYYTKSKYNEMKSRNKYTVKLIEKLG